MPASTISNRLSKIRYLIFILLLVGGAVIYYREKFLVLDEGLWGLFIKFISASRLDEFSFKFLAISIISVLLLGIVEGLVVGWENSALKRILRFKDSSTRGDVVCWVLSIFSLYDFFVLVFSFGFFYVVCSIIVHSFNWSFGVLITNVYWQFVVLFFLNDLKNYVWHWSMHKVLAFWELHQYHHSAKYFNMITNTRGHFLEKGIHTVFDAMIFILFGAPPEMFYYIVILREVYTMFVHSEIDWQLGWVGKYILVSPAAHKLHHSIKKQDFDKNFGTFFIFWDRFFGTYSSPDHPIEIGLEQDPYNTNSFWKDMVLGNKNFFNQLERSLKFKSKINGSKIYNKNRAAK